MTEVFVFVSQVETAGLIPSPRRAFASHLADSRHWLINGGFDGDRYLADTVVFDAATLVWSPLPSSGKPNPVCFAVYAYVCSEMIKQ